MFGYVTPLAEELRVKEHIFYKSVYCGLCRTMGKCVCNESRMTLSYDIVFLALVRMAMSGDEMSFKTGRCAVNPFKKRVFLQSNPSLEYSASAGALLAYRNIEDNVNDSKGLKKAASRTVLAMSRRMKKKAGLSELDEIIVKRLSELSELEKSGEASLDSAASCFGELLSEVVSFGFEGKNARIASQIGYHVGKWIYTADAIDDYSRDKKNGEFNPLSDIDKISLECAMKLELKAASDAFELVDCADAGIKNIIDNIIYLGMPSRLERLLSKYRDSELPKEYNINGKESL